jgi:hypothetical protein
MYAKFRAHSIDPAHDEAEAQVKSGYAISKYKLQDTYIHTYVNIFI